jgi:hypothetical protein
MAPPKPPQTNTQPNWAIICPTNWASLSTLGLILLPPMTEIVIICFRMMFLF